MAQRLGRSVPGVEPSGVDLDGQLFNSLTAAGAGDHGQARAAVLFGPTVSMFSPAAEKSR